MRYLLTLLLIMLPSVSQADGDAVCDMEFAKGSCWDKYEVTLEFVSSSYPEFKNKMVLLPKDSSVQKQFSCKLTDRIIMSASYTPPIWDDDQGAVFKQKVNWLVPKDPPAVGGRFLYKICFPHDFTSAPTPPTAGAECGCVFKNVDTGKSAKRKK